MKKIVMKLAIPAALLSCNPGFAQLLPPAPKAASVTIVQGPALELARDGEAIITWTTNNPGGTDGHVGIVNYGTSSGNLSQTANSPIRLNRGHPETVFRVSVRGLNPQTVYYYTVTSTESDGTSDGVTSPVSQFTSAAPSK